MKKRLFNIGKFTSYLLVIVLTVSLAACAGPSSPVPGTSNPPPTGAAGSPTVTSPRPSLTVTAPPVLSPPAASTPPGTGAASTGSPSIQILAPVDFASFHCAVIEQELRVMVDVKNFKLVDKIGLPAASGEGHVIYYVDVTPPTAPGVSAVSAGGSYMISSYSYISWSVLPEGPHVIAAQLVNNDNTPLSPPVTAKVQSYLSYDSTLPRVKITSPSNGATVPAGNVSIQISITNFVNIASTNNPSNNGQGHVIFYMDVDAPMTPDKPALSSNGTYVISATNSYFWPNVTPGQHTFTVQLVNNDNTALGLPSLYPEVDKITVTVQ